MFINQLKKFALPSLLVISLGSLAPLQAHAFTILSGGNMVVGAVFATVAHPPSRQKKIIQDYLNEWIFLFILDSGNIEVELQNVDQDMAQAAGLSDAERVAYNDSLVEIDLAIAKVASAVTEDTTQEDVLRMIEAESDIVGEEAINGLLKLIEYNQTS